MHDLSAFITGITRNSDIHPQSRKMSESLTYRYQILTGVAGLFILGYIISKAKYSSRPIDKELLLPPGPPGLPLIGNVHQFLGKSIASVLEQWNKEYGMCLALDKTS